MDPQRKRYYWIGAILLTLWLAVWLTATLVWNRLDADRVILRQIWSPETGWSLGDGQPWRFLYEFGTIPAFALTFISLLAWYRSLQSPKWIRFRRYFLLYSLTSIVGAGLIVNALLKEYTGRPRPREVVEFGGNWEYRAALELGIPGQGQSFPCGHCTMGFIFASGVMFWNYSPPVAIGSLALGLGYGTLMSTARLLQGAHYVSDAFWSLGVMGATFICFYFFVLQPPLSDTVLVRKISNRTKWRLRIGITACLILITVLYSTRRPFFKEHQRIVSLSLEAQHIELVTNVPAENWDVEFTNVDHLIMDLQANGFAFPASHHDLDVGTELSPEGIIQILVNSKTFGYFPELHEAVTLKVPIRFQHRLSLTPLPP